MPVIVVGVDGSDASAAALATAARLAADTGHGIVAVHVAHLPGLVAATPEALAAGTALTADDELAGRCQLDCELALAGTGIAWAFEVRYGDPATELARAGNDHDACIVVGRHGHRFLGRVLLGSVADRLVHHASCPVLVVPPTPHDPPPPA